MKKIILISALALIFVFVVFGSLFLAGKADWLIYVFYHPGGDNPGATAASYAELEEFVRNYSTANYPADWGCSEYAQAFHNDAEAVGMKTAIIVVRCGSGVMGFHTANAIQTTDWGIVYVEPILGWDLGRVAIAELIDGVVVAEIIEGNYIKIARLGYEDDFMFFW